MRGRFEYKKICKHCGNTFTAYKSTTNYCSLTCANRANKQTKRNERLQSESEAIKEQKRQNLLSQNNLSLTDAATLLGISRPTLYKLLNDKNIELLRISQRTIRVKQSDLLSLYQSVPVPIAPINTPITEVSKAQEDYIRVPEALLQFNISLALFYKRIRIAQIRPTIINGKTLYPLKPLKKIFAQKQYADITEWCTVNEITEKYGVSKQYIYEYTSDHKVPKKRAGKVVLISKYHWEQSKGLDPAVNESYYTVPQATEKYDIGRGHLYDLTRFHKVPKIKRGEKIWIHRQTLDNIMSNRK